MMRQANKNGVKNYMRLFLRIISSILVIFILFAIIPGCKGSSNVKDTNNTGEQVYDQNKSQSPEDDGEETDSTSDDIPPLQTDTGKYQGQIDSNFIEIEISGVPKENAAKVFMLSDELKEKFYRVEPSTNDVIKFEYYTNENNQNVIVELKSLY